MDPFGAVMALWALSKTRPRNPELVAYAVPSKGLGVVTLPDGKKLVLGNGYAYVTHWTGTKIQKLIYGDQTTAQSSLPWLTDVSMPHELMTAKFIGSVPAFVIKYKTSVWVVSEQPPTIIATVDQGKYLGQNLTGSKEDASALITSILRTVANLDTKSTIIGRLHAFC
jgi:hypothetical protein